MIVMLSRFRTTAPPVVIASAMATTLCMGCQRDDGIRELTVPELSSQLTSSAPPSVFDANSARVRSEYGVIPGATMLTSASEYDVSLLPSDKANPVVFYCSSTWCSAARTAAERAREAGHTEVCVLPKGIKGWTSAGLETDKSRGEG